MTGSTLDLTGETQPQVSQGHGTGALGPSDSSDSGSDMQNATAHNFDVDGELDQHALEQGPAELDSDTDRHGTGERTSADGDSNLKVNADLLPDGVDDETGIGEDPEQDEAGVDELMARGENEGRDR